MKPLQRAAQHFKNAEYESVIQICSDIVAANPGESRAWQMRGLAALNLKNFEAAAKDIAEATKLRPSAASFANLAVAFLALDRPEEAARNAQRAVELEPDNLAGLLCLAAYSVRTFSFEEAERYIDRCLELNPGWPKALDMRARVALRRGDVTRAFETANAALAADPSLSVSHRVLGDIAMRDGDYQLAAHHYQKSLANNPDDPETHGNFALLLARSGEYELSEQWYRRAVGVLRDDAALQHGFGDVLLIQGKLEEGWSLHAWRHLLKDENLPIVDQTFPVSLPRGGAAVAVLDQGVGDQILMASLIPDLQARTSALEVQCDPRLKGLFSQSFPGVRFTSHTLRSTPGAKAVAGSFGVADVARWLRPDFASFPRHSGYLKADHGVRKELRKRYTRRRAPVVGIAWATRKSIKLGPHKSVPLSAWGPLLSVPGLTFVSLQYNSDPEEIASARRNFGAHIISDSDIPLDGDLDAFAAQVAAMDLVITTSNVTAHMAGGLGVPAWVFVPTGMGALWHWFLKRDDSPWYPSVRLYRQSVRGDWGEVIERAAADLVMFLEGFPS